MKTLSQLKELDTIEIASEADQYLNIINNWNKNIEEQKPKLDVNFFLLEGVLKLVLEDVENDKTLQYTYFKILSEKSIELQVYIENKNQFIYFGSIILKIKNDKMLTHKTSVNKKMDFLNSYKIVNSAGTMFLATFQYITYIIDNKETKIKYITNKDSNKTDKNTKIQTSQISKENTNISNNKHIINLSKNKIEYKISINNTNSKALELFKRVYDRRTEAWTVAGHTRVYKSGKTVYIKPYTKGEGKKNIKVYKV